MTTAEKYIRIKLLGETKSGLTNIWAVENVRTQERCGLIRWHGAFRKYCFFPTNDFLFDASCLQAIVDHLNEKNINKRKKI